MTITSSEVIFNFLYESLVKWNIDFRIPWVL